MNNEIKVEILKLKCKHQHKLKKNYNNFFDATVLCTVTGGDNLLHEDKIREKKKKKKKTSN